jgi:hypothetical protein
MKDKKLQEFIKKRKHLVWWVKDYSKLRPKSIVEATLNYGNWDDVQELVKVMGIENVASIFEENTEPDTMGRQNYRPEIKHYFHLYFQKHAKKNA